MVIPSLHYTNKILMLISEKIHKSIHALPHLLTFLMSLLNGNSHVKIFTILIPEIISFILLHLSSVSLAVLSLGKQRHYIKTKLQFFINFIINYS